MYGFIERLRRGALYSFRPPQKAKPAEVRKAGLALTGIGLAILALGLVLLLLLAETARSGARWVERVYVPIFIVGFVVVIVAGYRAVFGSEPDESQSTL